MWRTTKLGKARPVCLRVEDRNKTYRKQSSTDKSPNAQATTDRRARREVSTVLKECLRQSDGKWFPKPNSPLPVFTIKNDLCCGISLTSRILNDYPPSMLMIQYFPKHNCSFCDLADLDVSFQLLTNKAVKEVPCTSLNTLCVETKRGNYSLISFL